MRVTVDRGTLRRRSAARGHASILAVAVITLILSVLITPSTGYLDLFGVTIPDVCTYRRVFGVECLGCGMTRSFVFMGHLDPAAAFAMNKAGPLLFLVTAAQVPLRIWRLVQHRDVVVAQTPSHGDPAAVTPGSSRSST